MSVIHEYAESVLDPQLVSLGLNPRQRGVVLEDVTQRLESLLSHWKDQPFRRTVLVVGTEEASFWEPRSADLEVRALVVVTVRNSLVTDLNADRAYTPELRSRRVFLSDERMPWITGEAIKYFQAASLDDVQIQPRQDMFGSLPRRFPNAWHVLSLLGNSSDNEFECELPMTVAEPMDLSRLQRSAGDRKVLGSGIDPGLDRQLAEILELAQKGGAGAILTPSFKHITRNPEKLLSVIDHMLRYGKAVVTPNYLLSPTYLARRNLLLRPIHFDDEMASRLANPNGLTQRHRDVLASLQGNE